MGRKAWIDYIKAFAIIMVVYGHAAIYYKPESAGRLYMSVIHLIYAIHMPLFFIVSGYLYKPHKATKLLKAFFLPMLCYFILCFGFKYQEVLFPLDYSALIKELSGTATSLIYNYKGQYTEPMTGTWFLMTLVFLRLIAGDFSATENSFLWRNKFSISILLIVSLSLVSLFWANTYALVNAAPFIKAITCCLPFFLLGKIIKEHEDRFFNLSKPITALCLFIYVVTAFMNTFICRASNSFIDLSYSRIGNPYLFTYIAAAAAFLGFANLFRHFKENRLITILSQGTLFILGTHLVILSFLNKFIERVEISSGNFNALIISVACIFLLIILLFPVQKKLKFLLGK